jgi:hypothetical protein
MHEAAYWLGFFGAWLLFAGPAYQSALELQEEEAARTRMQQLMEGMEEPPKVSVWWWLLPPVAIVLRWRRRVEVSNAMQDAMSDEDWTVVGHYISVARGWALVSAGAWCIFLKEAWELGEHRGWSRLGYWIVVMLLTAFAAGAAGAGSARARGERPARRR